MSSRLGEQWTITERAYISEHSVSHRHGTLPEVRSPPLPLAEPDRGAPVASVKCFKGMIRALFQACLASLFSTTVALLDLRLKCTPRATEWGSLLLSPSLPDSIPGFVGRRNAFVSVCFTARCSHDPCAPLQVPFQASETYFQCPAPFPTRSLAAKPARRHRGSDRLQAFRLHLAPLCTRKGGARSTMRKPDLQLSDTRTTDIHRHTLIQYGSLDWGAWQLSPKAPRTSCPLTQPNKERCKNIQAGEVLQTGCGPAAEVAATGA